MQIEYQVIFNSIEKTLKSHLGLSDELFSAKYVSYLGLNFEIRSDDDYFDILKLIPFYSGFKADTVTKKKGLIDSYFPNFRITSLIGDEKIKEMLSDKDMIKHHGKISSTIKNAKTFRNIVNEYGSFHRYIESFNPTYSFENLILLKEELEYKFAYLGGITVYHFLTDIGLFVLKPDRVITRIFNRLGLIENERQLLKTIIHGRKFAEATGLSIRYIDIILVSYGQKGIEGETDIEGVCLSQNPKCELCNLTNICSYYKNSAIGAACL